MPSDGEWMTLELVLGMTLSQANSTGWRGTDEGAQLKTTSWGGTNNTGFSALPGGFRASHDGDFNNEGNFGYWWASYVNGTSGWNRFMTTGISSVNRSASNSRSGFSVRCVRD